MFRNLLECIYFSRVFIAQNKTLWSCTLGKCLIQEQKTVQRLCHKRLYRGKSPSVDGRSHPCRRVFLLLFLEYIVPVIFLFPGQKNMIDVLGFHQEDRKNHLNTSGNVALTHLLCWPSLTPGAASYHCFAGNWAGECGSCNQLKWSQMQVMHKTFMLFEMHLHDT